MPLVNPNDPVKCPHCGEELDGVAEDWVVIGKVGFESTETAECGHCDGIIQFRRIRDGKIEIEGLDENGDYLT